MRVLCRSLPLLKYGDLNHILPFSEGRSDAACRVVIPPFAVPIDARLVANGGRCRMRRRTLPAMPPVGAGSSPAAPSRAASRLLKLPIVLQKSPLRIWLKTIRAGATAPALTARVSVADFATVSLPAACGGHLHALAARCRAPREGRPHLGRFLLRR